MLFHVTVVPSRVGAEEASAQTQASAHYDAGLAAANRGDFDGAVAEFEAAYRAQPHHSVLFNLGQAHAALGHSVDAVDVLQRYLSEAGPQAPASLRAAAEESIRVHEQRIGLLDVQAHDREAEIVVDGRTVGHSPLQHPLRLVRGIHGVVVRAPRMRPWSGSVEVEPGETAHLEVDLEPLPPQPSEKSPPSATSTDGSGAELTILTNPPRALVMVDGAAHTSGPLPEGPHQVEVRAAGFQPWRGRVDLSNRDEHRLFVELVPERQQFESRPPARRSYRPWALGIASGGATLELAAGFVYWLNTTRYQRWQSDRAEINRALAGGRTDPTILADNVETETRAASVARVDGIALGMAVAGGVALVCAAALWFSEPAQPQTTSTR